jgi:MFS family permease
MAGAYILASFTFQYPMAYVADRFGRRRLIVVAVLGHGLLALLYLLHLSPLLLVGVRFLQGLANGAVGPAVRAMVSDLVPDKHRGEAFGAIASADMLGILGGPLLGGAIAAIAPLEYVFVIQTLLSALACGFFVLLTRGLAAEHAVAAESRNPLAGLRTLLTIDLVGLGILAAAGRFLYGLYDTVWVLFMKKLGAGPLMTGFSLTVFAIPLFIFSSAGGRLGDRFGRRLPLVVGTFGIGITAISYPLLPGVFWVLVVGAVEGILFTLVRPNLFALVAAAAPPGMAARAQAAIGVLGIVGDLSAPTLAAVLWTRDYHWPFYAGGAFVTLAASTGTLLIYRRGTALAHVRQVPGATAP